MPHILTDTLCQITASAGSQTPVQHVVTTSTSVFTHSELTAGRDFNASVSHILVYVLHAVSIFLRLVTCRFCSVQKNEEDIFVEMRVPFLPIAVLKDMFVLGLNDLLLNPNNINKSICVL